MANGAAQAPSPSVEAKHEDDPARAMEFFGGPSRVGATVAPSQGQASPSQASVPDGPTVPTTTGLTAEEYEEQTFLKLSKKNAMRRPAAASQVLKRPGADSSGAPPLKKPAMAAIACPQIKRDNYQCKIVLKVDNDHLAQASDSAAGGRRKAQLIAEKLLDAAKKGADKATLAARKKKFTSC